MIRLINGAVPAWRRLMSGFTSGPAPNARKKSRRALPRARGVLAEAIAILTGNRHSALNHSTCRRRAPGPDGRSSSPRSTPENVCENTCCGSAAALARNRPRRFSAPPSKATVPAVGNRPRELVRLVEQRCSEVFVVLKP